MGWFQGEVLAKTTGLYQVSKVINLSWIFLTEGRREGGTTDRQSDLYYPLVANKNGWEVR